MYDALAALQRDQHAVARMLMKTVDPAEKSAKPRPKPSQIQTLTETDFERIRKWARGESSHEEEAYFGQ